MRLRMPVVASAAVAVAAVAVPAAADAAPIHHPAPKYNHSLSIHATPNHITAGESVLIYGRLTGRDSADQMITLYHRIAPASRFTRVGSTRTNAEGQYEFPRAEGVVKSSRRWYVLGPVHSHSKTITEHVAGTVTINQSVVNGTTRHPVTFSGTVTGGNHGSLVRLQQQIGDGNLWRTIKVGHLTASGSYSLSYQWRTAGERNVRVEFGGSPETTSSVSDAASVVIQQRQAPYFTINTSDAIVTPGTTTMISGTLDELHTSTPEANTEVALYKYVPGHGSSATPTQVATTTTGTDGSYSFSVANTSSALYQVKTVNAANHQATAEVFQGVRDTVTMSSSASTSTIGGSVTLSGTVSPADSGAVVYLEELGSYGHWQVVGTSSVNSSSMYSFNWTFGYAGTKDFRAHVVGGPTVVGGYSPATGVSVAQPAISQLPSING